MEELKNKLASRKWLRKLPDGMTYTQFFPMVKYYNAYNSGYNSRERMGKRLFSRIIETYVDVLVDEMVNHRKIVVLSSHKQIGMGILGEKKQYMTKKEYIESLELICYYRNFHLKLISPMIGYMSHSMKRMVVDAVNNGVIYYKSFKDARKFKVLQG